MSSRLGPVITLTAGAVLALGLGAASIAAAPAAKDSAAAPAAKESAATGTRTDTTANTPTAEASPSGNAESAEESTASASPSPTPTEPKKIEKADYGGRVKGNGALIAISIRNGKAVGYFCDGRIEAWFTGAESAGELRLKSVADPRSTVKAELDGGRAEGTVTVAGKRWSFKAPAVTKPSGLYRATAIVRGAKFRAGWILVRNPNGGYYQVGAAFAGEEQLDVPQLDAARPTAPITVEGTTVYPKDADSFVEEMQ
ncbi:hypothetical protein ACFMQL_08600 [Nonomuraea fastidiosa]|jgi:hypothetical protein|uniref:hypothetical protein n=1 Tax=Nonomuraea TaxID=83681 RepID=UPI00324F07AF